MYKKEYDEILRDEFEHKFGTETKIVIEHVDEIPREQSGKFRMIKNNIVEGGDFYESDKGVACSYYNE